MKVERVELRLIGLPLVRPFRTSFGTSTEKVCVVVRVDTDVATGWGECVADIDPGFSEEFNEGVWLLLHDWLVPALFVAGEVGIDDVGGVFASVRGHPMAKATLIDAIVDAELRARGWPLARYLDAERDRVACGVSVGIARTTDELVDQVAGYLDEGYQSTAFVPCVRPTPRSRCPSTPTPPTPSPISTSSARSTSSTC
jgi:o-succinylbenzoate synthase